MKRTPFARPPRGRQSHFAISLLLPLLICLMASSRVASAQNCLPQTNTPITVDGIVVGADNAGPLPNGCSADPGWAGVVGQQFHVLGVPDTHKAWLFLASRKAGMSIDRIYGGIHTEGDTQLTADDQVAVYFDLNNNGVFDTNDIALVFSVGPVSPPTNEICNQNPTSLVMYKHNGASWGTAITNPAGVQAKVGWDYDTNPPADGEDAIWEVEFSIDLSILGVIVPPSGLKVGAKIKMVDPVLNGTPMIFEWPSGVLKVPGDGAIPAGCPPQCPYNIADILPTNADVTAANLASLTFGACGNDVGIESVSHTTAFPNNKFNRNAVSFVDAQTTFNATVSFFDILDPYTPKSLGGGPANTGNLKFSLTPWGAGAQPIPMGTVKPNFTSITSKLGALPFSLKWPLNQPDWDAAKPTFAGSDHACLIVQVDGFNVNQVNDANDQVQQNLLYTTNSTVRDSFLVSAAGPEYAGREKGKPIEFVLRARWTNVPSKLIYTGHGPKGKLWRYRFVDPDDIGLKDLGKGYSSLTLKPGEQKRVRIEYTGTLPQVFKKYQLSPRAGGLLANPPTGDPPLEIPVKPGMSVAIVAQGQVTVDRDRKRRTLNGPNGIFDPDRQQSKFLLPESVSVGHRSTGAVIGSFDGFKESAFLIGSDATFFVLPGATRLFLAVNGVAGEFQNYGGKGFEINVVLGDPLSVPTRLVTSGNPNLGIPARASPAANMPVLDIDVMEINRDTKLLRPAGYVSYAVYASHQGNWCTRIWAWLFGHS